MAKRYSEEYKKNLVAQYKAGISVQNICVRHGIARSTLFLWVKQYTANADGRIPREQYLLQKELEHLRTENAIFRSCGCSPSAPLEVRLHAISSHQSEFSIHALCKAMQVNRSTYYHHTLRAPEQTKIQLEDNWLKSLITEIFTKSECRFGARKIRVKLMQVGYTVSERRILRLMKELGLSAQQKHPKINSANDRQYRYYPNKLKGKFLTDAPNKVWVSDITYAKVGMNFLYLCVVIDLYARKVIGYAISEDIDTKLTANAFDHAFASRGKPEGLLFHSDQGTQYTAFTFRTHLKACGVQQSFSAPGNPHDNAVAESFFATIKKEDFRQKFYKNETEFCHAVDRYIEFYNDYRPHQRLGFLTPNQAEEKFYQN